MNISDIFEAQVGDIKINMGSIVVDMQNGFTTLHFIEKLFLR